MSEPAFDRAETADAILDLEGWCGVLDIIGCSNQPIDARAIRMVTNAIWSTAMALRITTGTADKRKAPPCA